MTNEFIHYEQALALKELGFEEDCLAFYILCKSKNINTPLLQISKIESQKIIDAVNNIFDVEYTLAPLYQQSFIYFREKYNLRGFIGFRPNVKQFDCHIYDMSLSGKEYVQQRTMEEYNKDPKVGTYEEAELECLKQLIKLVKNNK